MKAIQTIIDSLNLNYPGEFGPIVFLIDVLLVIGLFTTITLCLYKKAKRKSIFMFSAIFVLLFFVIIILQLKLALLALIIGIIITTTSLALAYNHDNKHQARNHSPQNSKVTSNYISDQNAKEALIDTLVTTCEYFSSRKIGAIITIEKENSLNVYIEKAIKLDAEVSTELLKTIFFPNTALHDGAVIIRGNRIMCAAAYYTLSDKPDILNELGTRHRAAIGISEDSDAFTLVVSEETGKISTTIGGTITRGLTDEALRISLDQHIIVQ